MSKNKPTKPKPKTSGRKQPKVSADGPEVSRKHPDAHHGVPAKGCRCLCCWALRALYKRDERDRQVAEAWDAVHGHEPYDGQVHVGENATQAFREVMGALPIW